MQNLNMFETEKEKSHTIKLKSFPSGTKRLRSAWNTDDGCSDSSAWQIDMEQNISTCLKMKEKKSNYTQLFVFFPSGGQAVNCEVNFIFILDYKSRNKRISVKKNLNQTTN